MGKAIGMGEGRRKADGGAPPLWRRREESAWGWGRSKTKESPDLGSEGVKGILGIMSGREGRFRRFLKRRLCIFKDEGGVEMGSPKERSEKIWWRLYQSVYLMISWDA